MEAQTLREVMNTPGLPNGYYTRLIDGYNNAMRAANINTVKRAAMWAAQLGHESVGLKYMEEIADGSAYNGRRDLGNTQPGDGPRFKGRGPIQLTGRNNYRAFTKWANAQGHTTINFEAQPHKVSEPKWGFLAASWYWVVARPQINSMADKGDLEGVTRAINGGLNGLQDRRNRYQHALTFGDRLLPSGGGKGGNVTKVVHPMGEPNGVWSETSGYGPRWGTHHNGQDYGAPLGTPIYAVADGKVIQGKDRAAGSVSGFGNWVWIDHQNTLGVDTIYGHMRHHEIYVKRGDRVTAGQLIARVGSEGQSTGPHLHFEVWTSPGRTGGKHIDPKKWLNNNLNNPKQSSGGSSMFGPIQVAALNDAKLAAQAARDHAKTNTKKLDEIKGGAKFGHVQVGALHEAKVAAIAAEKNTKTILTALEAIDARLKLIEDQLIGPEQEQWPEHMRNPKGGRGWPQLGVNAIGQWRTVVDFLAASRKAK